jgi:hypothetical protein
VRFAMITIRNISEPEAIEIEGVSTLSLNCQNTSAWPS